jgi:hypothetical protein
MFDTNESVGNDRVKIRSPVPTKSTNHAPMNITYATMQPKRGQTYSRKISTAVGILGGFIFDGEARWYYYFFKSLAG